MISSWTVAAAAGAALVEAVPGVGAFLPGEVAISALSASAHDGAAWLILAATVGACIGDQVNYWAGRAFGPRVGTSRLVRRMGTARWERAIHMMRKHGARAVLLSRVVPVVRTIAPLAAGTAQLPPLRFLFASVAGCSIWATVWVLAGATFGHLLQTALPVVVILVVAGALGIVFWRRSRRGRRSASRAR